MVAIPRRFACVRRPADPHLLTRVTSRPPLTPASVAARPATVGRRGLAWRSEQGRLGPCAVLIALMSGDMPYRGPGRRRRRR